LHRDRSTASSDNLIVEAVEARAGIIAGAAELVLAFRKRCAVSCRTRP
jgi:hypothetical protein